MITDGLSDPSTIDQVDLASNEPDPADCLPPGETPIVVSKHPSGWIAVTERDVFTYRANRDPPLVRIFRANVTGLALRRSGGSSFIGYAPMAVLYAFAAMASGVLLSAVSPTDFIAVPDAPGVTGMATIVQSLAWATHLLGAILVSSGILAALFGVVAVGYWLYSENVELVIKRGNADPVECPTDGRAGQRVLRELENVLVE